MAVILCGAVPLYVLTSGKALFAVQIVKYSLIAGLYTALLMIAVAASPGSWTKRVLTPSWLRAWGKYSYGIYVLHPYVMTMVGIGATRIGWEAASASGLFGRILAVVLVVYGAAWLSFHSFEKRFLNLKRHFAYSHTGQPAPGQLKTKNAPVVV